MQKFGDVDTMFTGFIISIPLSHTKESLLDPLLSAVSPHILYSQYYSLRRTLNEFSSIFELKLLLST